MECNSIGKSFATYEADYVKEIQLINKSLETINRCINRLNEEVPSDKLCEGVKLVPTPPYIVQKVYRSAQELQHRYRKDLLPSDVFPDPRVLLEWEHSQNGYEQPNCRKIAEAILKDFVDFPTFVEKLEASIRRAESRMGQHPFGVVMQEELEKSGIWTLQLAKPLFKKAPTIILPIDYVKTRMVDKEHLNHWILVDDGAYSGLQIANRLKVLCEELLNINKTDEKIYIYLAIPFMTKRANELFKTLLDKWVKEEQISEADRARLEIIPCPASFLRSKAEILESQSDSNGVVSYFAHKVPDGYSRDMSVPAPRIIQPYKKREYDDRVYADHDSGKLYEL